MGATRWGALAYCSVFVSRAEEEGATRWGTLAYCSLPVSCGSVGIDYFVGPMTVVLSCTVRVCVGLMGWCWIRGCCEKGEGKGVGDRW